MKKKWAVVLAAIVMLLAMAIQTVEPIVYAAQSISSSQTVAGNEKTGSQTSSQVASTENEATNQPEVATGGSSVVADTNESASSTPQVTTDNSTTTTSPSTATSSSSSESSSSSKSSEKTEDDEEADIPASLRVHQRDEGVSGYTSLDVNKVWSLNTPAGKKVTIYPIAHFSDGTTATLDESYDQEITSPGQPEGWAGLPLTINGKTVDSYTVGEKGQDAGDFTSEITDTKESTIDEAGLRLETSQSVISWSQDYIPSFLIFRVGNQFVVWTLNPVDKNSFMTNVNSFPKSIGLQQGKLTDDGPGGEYDSVLKWDQGENLDDDEYGFHIHAIYNDDGSLAKVTIKFDDPHFLNKYYTGNYSTKQIELTNTYHPKVTIPVEKVWNDNNDQNKVRPDSIKVQLYANGVAKGDPITLDSAGDWKSEFKNLPKEDDQGTPITYTIKEVDGKWQDDYASTITGSEDSGFTITNKLTYNPLSLTVTKVSEENPDLKLPGAVFELSGGDLSAEVKLTDNGDGTYSLPDSTKLGKNKTYTLTEKTAPGGFETAGPWTIKVDKDGNVTVDPDIMTGINKDNEFSPVLNLTVKDKVKKQTFTAEKYTKDANGTAHALQGSTFILQKYTDSSYGTTVGNQQPLTGNVTTLDDLKPGYYEVHESDAPEGYKLDDTAYRFRIDDHGKFFAVSKDGTETEIKVKHRDDIENGGDGFYLTNDGLSFVKYDEFKSLSVRLKKIDSETQELLAGAEFTLTGPDSYKQTTTSDNVKDQDWNFEFKDLKPGTYTLTETKAPNGYTVTDKGHTIIVDANGNVTFDGKSLEKISNNNDSIIVGTPTIFNTPETILPHTGGSGIRSFMMLASVLLGLAVVLLAVVYIKRREVSDHD